MLGNVLVLGNSGVGKSTLVNAIVGEEVAYTSYGTAGTTKELKIYGARETEGKAVLPFKLIDTMGFEPDPGKAKHAVKLVTDWAKDAKKGDKDDRQIDLIWFCVDGCAAKLFLTSIECLAKAIKPWGDVPIIVVITKSYSEPDREKNIEMVYNAFARQTVHPCNLRGIIPVVAQTFMLNETSFTAPNGLSELIDKTVQLLPEGKQNSQAVINEFRLSRKRALSQSVIAASVASAVAVCALPLPGVDALPLSAIETTELNALAKIYNFKQDESLGKFTRYVLECGAVTGIARTLLSALKAIPGIGAAASVLNSVVAGSIVLMLGETVAFMYEQVYLGKKSLVDYEWISGLLENNLNSNSLLSKVQNVAKSINPSSSKKDVISAVISAFIPKEKKKAQV